MAVLALLVAMVVIVDTDWEVSHEVTIAASPSIVWSLLINAEGYAEWNRYSSNIKGRIAEGEVVWIEAHLDNDKVITSTLTAVITVRHFRTIYEKEDFLCVECFVKRNYVELMALDQIMLLESPLYTVRTER